MWVNGELEDQLDLDTYEYMTLAQMFAREVRTPAPQSIRVAGRQSGTAAPDACSSRAR